MVRSTGALLEYPIEPECRWGWGRPVHAPSARLLAKGVDHYAQVVDGLRRSPQWMASIGRKASPGQPCWENSYWTALDAVRQYVAIVDRRPRTYLEVGSGNSTLFARKAISDHGLSTRIVSVDPNPRADIDALCDLSVRAHLAQLDQTLLDDLGAGDVVLFDGSHVAFMGADTIVALLEILPRLPPGVLVGIHDVFLPWDYPPEWTKRWYGEQYLLGAFLLGEPSGWRIDFPTWYVQHETALLRDLDDVWRMIGDLPGHNGSAMWIESVGS